MLAGLVCPMLCCAGYVIVAIAATRPNGYRNRDTE